MKQLSIFSMLILFLFTGKSIIAQTGTCDIPLMVYISEQDESLPRTAESQLSNKLIRVAADNGLAASNGYAQFVISPQFSVLGKNILPGPPRSFVYDFELTLFIGDSFGQKIFSSTTLSLKGVGENETKAYIDAIRKIAPKSKDIQAFLTDGKDKIVEYYNNNYQNIIKKAQSLAAQKNFEEAMFLLMAIPECSKGYDASLAVASKVYQQYVDDMCNRYLNKARTAWASQQNSYGAEEAGEYLTHIYPDAKCYGDAMVLYKEIKAKVKDDWNFVMKMYNDEVNLEKQRINAWKEVGVAYGRGQQPSTTHVYWRH